MRKQMNRSSEWLRVLRVILLAGLASVIGLSCSSNKFEGKIIAVEQQNGILAGEGAALVLLDPAKPAKPAKSILENFEDACAPSLSHDGQYLFFQGKEKSGEPWQIWVLDLKKGKPSRVITLDENCTDPLSLPDGTVIFSRESSVKGNEVNELWRCGMDGCCLTQLTFSPAKNLYSSILREGRVLYLSSQQYPESRDAALMVMRPDGTKSEIYSYGCCGFLPVSGGAESLDGYIYFIAGEGQLCRVSHRRPLHTFEHLSEDLEGSFASVSPCEDGSILVSYRPDDAGTYKLFRMEPGTESTPALLFSSEKNLSDPVLIAAMETRPKILPSPVNPDNPTALLMTQDINHSMLPVHKGITGDSVASKIRISTMEGELAVVEAKEDGSVYLKLDADTPFRMETLNSQGEVVRGPSDWIYLRPGERRACTGCHADPELAPKNFQPFAVKEDPVVLITRKQDNN